MLWILLAAAWLAVGLLGIGVVVSALRPGERFTWFGIALVVLLWPVLILAAAGLALAERLDQRGS